MPKCCFIHSFLFLLIIMFKYLFQIPFSFISFQMKILIDCFIQNIIAKWIFPISVANVHEESKEDLSIYSYLPKLIIAMWFWTFFSLQHRYFLAILQVGFLYHVLSPLWVILILIWALVVLSSKRIDVYRYIVKYQRKMEIC